MEDSLKEFYFCITEEQDGERIDKILSILMENLSRSYIQKLLADKLVTVNNKEVKANYKVKSDDEIRLLLPPAVTPDIEAENIPLDILYEDEDVIVINKPKNMVVHPAAGHYSGTLVNALLYHCKGCLSGINGVLRPGIVHRIDKDTTGSIIVCKNDYSHNHIAMQLKEHSINRKYHALVCGVLKEDEGTVHTNIGRHPNDRKKMAVVAPGSGKEAITHYKVLQRFEKYTYVECTLETGRTHQIRVHMSHLGYPLLGDEIYGRKEAPFRLEGQCLHAKILGFIHPRSQEYIETEAPLPAYFEKLLQILK